MSDFHITPEHATDLAQMAHNAIDTNGVINEEGIIEVLLDQYAEYLRNNISWDTIKDNDKDAKEFVEQREEAAKGEW